MMPGGLSANVRQAIGDRVVIEVRLVFTAGLVVGEDQRTREWTYGALLHGKGPNLDIEPTALPFMSQPRKSWGRPQDPVVFSAQVVAGREAEAIAWLESL